VCNSEKVRQELISTEIREDRFEGMPAFVLESDRARVVVLPRIGGKVASLVDKTTGEELLWRNPDRGYREPAYGTGWAEYDMSGWEDCLPTVAASSYPEWPWQGVLLPEHGEVWALPWDPRSIDGGVELVVHGVRLPYRFEKHVSLDGNRVRLRHRIVNPSAFPIRYVWATHPLFRVRPGTRVVLPTGVRVRVDWSRDGRLGPFLTDLPWPTAADAAGRLATLDRVGEPSLGYADKLYTTAIREGWCGLRDPDSGQAVGLTFDPRRLPYLGVWINQGGWPLTGRAGYNVALEPTCGYPDLLEVAVGRGAAARVGPGERQEWGVELRFGRSDSVQDLLER
jgi:galactose mutarotase-like enzyme